MLRATSASVHLCPTRSTQLRFLFTTSTLTASLANPTVTTIYPTTTHPAAAMSTSAAAPYPASTPLAAELAVALQAVRLASRVTTSVYRSLPKSGTVTKSDKSPVTIGDFAAQAIVNTALRAQLPQDAIVGEEDADELRASDAVQLKEDVVRLASQALAHEHAQGRAAWADEAARSETALLAAIDAGNFAGGEKGRFWALDPIDGTKGFLRGGQYAVCLGLVVDGQVVLGVMACPRLPQDKTKPKPTEGAAAATDEADDEAQGLGTIFWAERGHGAWQAPLFDVSPLTSSRSQRITSLSNPPLTASTLSTASFCESVEAGHSSHSTNARVAHLLAITRPAVRMDSQAKYASLARGDGQLYLRLPVGDGSYREKTWDHAAGSLLVVEAGGTVTDAAGRPLDFGRGRTLEANRGVVAVGADQQVHAKVVEAVAQALREENREAILKL